MPEPKRLRILKHLTAILEGVNYVTGEPLAGEGYEADLRGKVFRGRTEVGAEVEKPFMALNEPPKPFQGTEAGLGGEAKVPWQVLAQGFGVNDSLHPGDPAYDLMAQAQIRLSRVNARKTEGMGAGDAMYPEDFMLDGKLTAFHIGEGVVQPPTVNVSNTAYFYFPVVLEFVSNPAKPYAD